MRRAAHSLEHEEEEFQAYLQQVVRARPMVPRALQ
jgi:hypothetical protein